MDPETVESDLLDGYDLHLHSDMTLRLYPEVGQKLKQACGIPSRNAVS